MRRRPVDRRGTAWRTRSLRERGAVAMEAALVFPILIVLALGVGEYGIAWRDRLTVQTAVRSAARVASSMGKDSQADYNALQALQSALGNISNASVTKIVVYKSTAANGQVPAACLTASQTGLCNTYTGTNLTSASSLFGCGAGDLDIPWCPTTRVVDQASVNGPDYVGVYVSVKRTYISGLFGKNGYTITDSTVFRLEPQ